MLVVIYLVDNFLLFIDDLIVQRHLILFNAFVSFIVTCFCLLDLGATFRFIAIKYEINALVVVFDDVNDVLILLVNLKQISLFSTIVPFKGVYLY
jgi:hypothetical protein